MGEVFGESFFSGFARSKVGLGRGG